MSLLGDLLGGQGQSPQGGTATPASMMTIIGELIQRAGGLQGLLSLLQQHGLGGAVQSWVGTGSNQPVSGDQLGEALHHGGMGSLIHDAAAKLGVDPAVVLGGLSNMLPHAVDHLTPEGQVPEQTQNEGGGFDLGMLEGLAGKLLG